MWQCPLKKKKLYSFSVTIFIIYKKQSFLFIICFLLTFIVIAELQ